MNKFSIPGAAFSGYRLLAAKPAVAVTWFLFQLAIALFTAFVTVRLAGPQLAQLSEMRASGAMDQATMMALTMQTLPHTIFKMLFPLLTGSIASAAVTRAVLRPANGGFGYLRFGGDELRLALVYLVLTILFVVPYLIATMVGMGVLAATAGQPGIMAVSRGAFGELPFRAMALSLLAMLPLFALIVFLGVKLSLAPAQTVAERGIRLFESWSLTKGQFWRVLLTYLLAAMPLAVVGAAALGIGMAIKGEGFAAITTALAPDTRSVAAAFGGTAIILHLLAAALQTLVMAGQNAPAATIYAALAGHAVESGAADDDDDDDED